MRLMIAQGDTGLPESSDPMEALSMTIRFSLGLTQAIQHVGDNAGILGTGISGKVFQDLVRARGFM